MTQHFKIKDLGMGDWSITPLTDHGIKKIRYTYEGYPSGDDRLFMEGNTLVIVHQGVAENLCNYFDWLDNRNRR